MEVLQIVIDTNVVVSAFRSRRGASYRLLSLVGERAFEINLSVPLAMEWEDVLSRPELRYTPHEIETVINYLCLEANLHDVFYLWRPFLTDPNDDMVLELAVKARCQYIVTFNQRDFRGAESFGLSVVSPRQFLQIIGEIP